MPFRMSEFIHPCVFVDFRGGKMVMVCILSNLEKINNILSRYKEDQTFN